MDGKVPVLLVCCVAKEPAAEPEPVPGGPFSLSLIVFQLPLAHVGINPLPLLPLSKPRKATHIWSATLLFIEGTVCVASLALLLKT